MGTIIIISSFAIESGKDLLVAVDSMKSKNLFGG
jgi:hypothetical protein